VDAYGKCFKYYKKNDIFCEILVKSNCNFIKLVVEIGLITFLCKFISIFITALFEKKIYCPIYGAIQNLPIYGLPIYAENPYMGPYMHVIYGPIYDFFTRDLQKITISRSPRFTFIPKTGVRLPYTGVSLYCEDMTRGETL